MALSFFCLAVNSSFCMHALVQTIELKDGRKIISLPDLLTGNFASSGIDSVKEDVRWGCFYIDWDYPNEEWKYEFHLINPTFECYFKVQNTFTTLIFSLMYLNLR